MSIKRGYCKNYKLVISLTSIFDLLSVVFVFFVIDLMVSIDFVSRTCAQSTVLKV